MSTLKVIGLQHTAGTSNNIVLAANGNITVANTLSLGNSSIAANGYTYLPNGLIMQWGYFTCNATPGGPVTVTFPLTFPTNLYSISISQKHASTGGTVAFNAESTSGFTCRNSINTGDILFYQAIGK